MKKLYFLFILNIALQGCASTTLDTNCRAPASLGLKCSAFIKNNLSSNQNNDAAKDFADHLDTYQFKLLQATDTDQKNRIMSKELKGYVDEGAAKFLDEDSDFIFKNNMKLVEESSGLNHDKTFVATHQGQNFFIKQLPTINGAALILKEIQNAKLLALIGISPKVELVVVDGIPFLVMEQVSGINIKEVLVPESRTPFSGERINNELGLTNSPVDESARTFARIVLAQPEYEARLKTIATELTNFGFTSTRDFQFMIDLNKGPSSIVVIDSVAFRRNEITPQPPSPNQSVEKILDVLKKASRGEN